MSKAGIGVIGGSGLYEMPDLKVLDEIAVETPFGSPSDRFLLGETGGRKVVFLPRHGAGHRLLPGEIPFRANIYGMKKLGVERIISVSAVGSMKEDIHPREIVIPDQFIDRTRGREDTFFGDGIVAHISFSDPVCPYLADLIAGIAAGCGAGVHKGGTYVCIEGPAFSTRAESKLYRGWDVEVIGMTNYQEAKLAREAEICYATIACVTDYDCWHESEESVSLQMLIDNLNANTAMARNIICTLIPEISSGRDCLCADALKAAVFTPEEHMPAGTREKLALILDDR